MKSLAALTSTLLGLFLLCGLITPAKADAVSFSNIWAGQITPASGKVGVDIWWPDHGVSNYNPCHTHSGTNDIYYGACVMSNIDRTSYYKVMHFGPLYADVPGWSSASQNDFPYGVFIDNTNPNYCTSASWCPNPSASTINHGWANLITGAALEIYPHNANRRYDPYTTNIGGVRININGFPHNVNGGRYSTQLGNISLPQIGQPNVGKLNGFVTENGVPVANNRVNIDAFQNGATRYTSTGYPMSGFSSVPNKGQGDGYYNTGAVPSGNYKIYITDNNSGRKIILDGVNINLPYERLDFQLEKHCFGHPNLNCTDPAN